MLDTMMASSNLPLAEQRRLRAACAAGPSAQMQPRRKPLPVGRKPKFEDPLKGVAINPMIARQLPGGAGRVTQAEILRSHGGSLERDQFRGGQPAGTSSEIQKEELQNLMTYGSKRLPEPARKRTGAAASNAPQCSAESSLRAQISDEIAERQDFLETMRAMGRGAEHEAKVKGEISERMQDLKALDRLESSGP